ncbi:creatininase family protein [Gordonia insulae]|uniref:Creatinine amidohydrolase n=1 Tax=Gordonia insulae TaxID=2420509 RepID=A0A3G8JSR5_9ACTN|nr:creatininase family protein [Gordonia insulae]AZG47542.1 Creatinine amidohydrolase [Gordonia insulae]
MTIVRWEELMPREFVARQAEQPLVYLPMGLCEPHGHPAAFGLDTFKAVWLCEQAARRHGGVVAPTQGYHIHETGYHRPWLAEVIGGPNPYLAAVPPDVLLRMLLFQMRAFANAGFRGIVIVTGHHGNQADLRLVAEEFTITRPIQILAVSDPELVSGVFAGDHAGNYELSQLLHVRPDLVDLGRVPDESSSPLGRFAQGDDAVEASGEHGRAIMEAALDELGRRITDLGPLDTTIDPLSIDDTELIWRRILARRAEWRTLSEQDPDENPSPQHIRGPAALGRVASSTVRGERHDHHGHLPLQ